MSFDLDTYLRMPRLSGLRLSPDGTRLVVGVGRPAPSGTRFRSALWEIDPSGSRGAGRITRSTEGESPAGFLPDGTVLFTSPRPDPDAAEPDDEPPRSLWALPAGGGEARLLVAPAGGVSDVAVARHAGTMLLAVPVHPGAEDLTADRARADAREEAEVQAQLFTGYPIRYWDSWLGPREDGLWVADPPRGEARIRPRPVLRGRGRGLDELSSALTPDGTTVVTTWRRTSEPEVRDRALDLLAIDVATGDQRSLLADGHWYHDVAVSPDGTRVACIRGVLGTPDRAGREELVLVNLTDGSHRVVAQDLDLWPIGPVWLGDAEALLFTADDHGRRPVFRVDLADDTVTRLTADGSHTDLCTTPEGDRVYALRSALDRPPHVVALDPATPDQDPEELPSPVSELSGPGRVRRISAAADDGTAIESWLITPVAASPTAPAPLVVFIHGGPLGSWNAWHWRWNPHVLVERGYAVLLPDPALSTGYGNDFVARGWGDWRGAPYTDLIAAVDQAVATDEIDHTRTAAMGGSFGGYMANWVAGQTDRFRCIVTHASLWHLEAFHGTTDEGPFWEREFGDPYEDPSPYRTQSPRNHVADIRTPMLVIHGEKDYRVPVSEALQLWTDLARHGVEAQFLYFPDENHWIEKPQNIRLWYETVLAFLDHHVRGSEWSRPDLL